MWARAAWRTAGLMACTVGLPITLASQQPVEFADLSLETGFQDAFLGHHNRGRACASADFDLDGIPDFYVGNPGDPSFIIRGAEGVGGALTYELVQQLTFMDQTAWGGAAADFDNDGDPDLFVTLGANEGADYDRLYENKWIDGGVLTGVLEFENISDRAGIGGKIVPGRPGELTPVASAHANWGDYDNDGWLDIFVSVNVPPPPLDITPPYPTKGMNVLWRNNGDGTFEDVTVEVGLGRSWGRTRHSSWLDFDNDGDLDLYENNFGNRQIFWKNNLKETGIADFRDVTELVSFPGTDMGWPIDTFASAATDFNNDGWTDIIAFVRAPASSDCSSLRSQGEISGADSPADPWGTGHALLLNLGGLGLPMFFNVSVGAGLQDIPLPPFNGVMGSQVGDLNADGVPDIFIGNGGAGGGRQDQLYLSDRLEFLEVPGRGVLPIPRYENFSLMLDYPAEEDPDYPFPYAPFPYRTHGTCMVDADRDGLLEMAVINGGPSFFDDRVREPNRLFKPVFEGDPPHYFQLRLEGNGTTSNRDAIGARIALQVGDDQGNSRIIHETLFGGSGFSGQNGLDVFFGLGDSDRIFGLRVVWPDGTTSEVKEGLEVDTTLELLQP